MYDKLIKDFKQSLHLKKDSKLAVYVDDDLDFIYEIKNLNHISASFFLLIILDKLIKDNIVDKELILDMINEIL